MNPALHPLSLFAPMISTGKYDFSSLVADLDVRAGEFETLRDPEGVDEARVRETNCSLSKSERRYER